MKDETANEFWRRHLVGVENPLVHFVPSNLLDVEVLEKESSDLGFELFLIEAKHIKSVSGLLDAFAEAMDFPSYFGKNWDALLDMTRDLSWNKANGYVLVLSNPDLSSLPQHDFSALLGVLEATIRSWRDERGEYGERGKPLPFHVIFSGSNALRDILLENLKEPVCSHKAPLSIDIVRSPGGVGETETFHDAQRLLEGGADLELILLFLRDRGYGQVESIYTTASLIGESVPRAKALVDHSQTWSAELSAQDAQLREQARKALRDLGFS